MAVVNTNIAAYSANRLVEMSGPWVSNGAALIRQEDKLSGR